MDDALKQPDGSQASVADADSTQDNLPDKFKGKSLEDVVKSYQELESKHGKMSEEVGQTKKERDALRGWYDQAQAQAQQQQQVQQPAPVEPDTNWYDSPDQAFDKRFEARMKNEKRQMEIKADYQNALSMGEYFKEMAKTKHPHLFEGITDEELNNAVYGGLAQGQIAPKFVRSINAWRGAAQLIRSMKTDFGMEGTQVQNPESLDMTDSPPQRKPMETDQRTRLTEEQAFLASHFEDPNTGKPYDEKVLIAKVQREADARGTR